MCTVFLQRLAGPGALKNHENIGPNDVQGLTRFGCDLGTISDTQKWPPETVRNVENCEKKTFKKSPTLFEPMLEVWGPILNYFPNDVDDLGA